MWASMMRLRAILAAIVCCSLGGGLAEQEPLMSYVTLWHRQVIEWGFDAAPHKLQQWLADVREAGIGHLVISVTWRDLEPKEGQFDFDAAHWLVSSICEADLKAAVKRAGVDLTGKLGGKVAWVLEAIVS